MSDEKPKVASIESSTVMYIEKVYYDDMKEMRDTLTAELEKVKGENERLITDRIGHLLLLADQDKTIERLKCKIDECKLNWAESETRLHEKYTTALMERDQLRERVRELEEELKPKPAILTSYQSLLEQAEKMERALEFYGNKKSYSNDYDTSQNGFSRWCILYGDIEEINQATGYAGRRARQAIEQFRAFKKKAGKDE